MLQLHKFVFNPFYENTYLIWDDNSNEAAVIDPGCYDESEKKKIEDFISGKSLQLKYLINTHCHIDHMFGNAFIKDNYNPIFLAPEKDGFLLEIMIETAKNYGVELQPSPKPDKYISESEEFSLGNIKGQFLFTPGHTPGEVCLYFKKEKICFTGDVLFKESIGRTDLWGGDLEVLLQSIKTKLLTLPDDVVIYPGHESYSTIGHEKKYNPFLR